MALEPDDTQEMTDPMSEVVWPVELVDIESGGVVSVASWSELNDVRYSGSWRLKRAIPGIDMEVAQPVRRDVPRTEPPPDERLPRTRVDGSVDAPTEPAPETPAASRQPRRRPAKKGLS